jgi:hypothetical protein
MKKVIRVGVGIAVSFLLGCGISNYYSKNLAATIAVGATSALVGGGATWLYYDTKINRIKNNLIGENNLLKNKQLQDEDLITELKNARNLSLKQLEETKVENKTTLEKLEAKLDKSESDDRTKQHDIEVLTRQLSELEISLKYVTAQRDEFKSEADFKEKELLAFENTFQDKLEKTYQETLKREIDLETTRQFDLLEESEQILDEMNKFVNEVYSRHQSQRHYTLDINEKFFEFKQKSDEKFQLAYDALTEEKMLLENSVSLLKQQLIDGIIHPVYGEYGLTGDIGKNINGMVEWSFRHLNIALKALRFEINEDIISFGLDYQKSKNPIDICENLNQNKVTLTKYLGIWGFTRIEYLPKYDAIAVSYRQHPPKPENDDDMYKAGLIPSRDFCDAIFRATDHTSGGKPTLRIMAATGEGKGICTKHLVNYFSQLPGWEIWVSDPIHGSEQDFWDCEKIAKNKSEARKAYKQFSDLHATRKDLKIDGFTSKAVIGVFDEFDKQHDDDDKETAAKIMTAIRHTRQRQILLGQTAEVGSNGWTWDDMKQCSLLVLGDSIGTLCKHLVKDLGWTLKKSNEVKRQYEKFSDWAEKKNESNPDIPGENRTRIGLLVVGSRYQFLELPIPHKGIIRSGAGIVRSNFDPTPSTNTQTETFTNNIPHPNNDSVNLIDKPEITCTHCHSTNFKRNRRVANEKLFNYSCKSCKKTFTSWNNKLS